MPKTVALISDRSLLRLLLTVLLDCFIVITVLFGCCILSIVSFNNNNDLFLFNYLFIKNTLSL